MQYFLPAGPTQKIFRTGPWYAQPTSDASTRSKPPRQGKESEDYRTTSATNNPEKMQDKQPIETTDNTDLD